MKWIKSTRNANWRCLIRKISKLEISVKFIKICEIQRRKVTKEWSFWMMPRFEKWESEHIRSWCHFDRWRTRNPDKIEILPVNISWRLDTGRPANNNFGNELAHTLDYLLPALSLEQKKDRVDEPAKERERGYKYILYQTTWSLFAATAAVLSTFTYRQYIFHNNR